jgi:hypothetical protein
MATGPASGIRGAIGMQPAAAIAPVMPPRLKADTGKLVAHQHNYSGTVQRSASEAAVGTSGRESNAVHETAQKGLGGGSGRLPHADVIQRSFGRHDVSGIRAHIGGPAAVAARSIGATAYAMGNSVAFGSAPDIHTAAHEAAHVVQQRAGVSLLGGVGRQGDPYEQHAEAVAGQVVQGRSAEHLLDRHPGVGIASRAVQRFAFVNQTQVTAAEKDLTSPMKAMVSDKIVRDYTGLDEFKKHADKKTDYLGNLAADGTWMRFNPAGINLLGENHTKVSLEYVVPAVGTKSFIYEQFSSDDMAGGSNIKQVYDKENVDLFKKFGVEGEKDKKQFGEESLFPKMGFGLTLAIPYFQNKAQLIKLTDDKTYVGQPIQRYLKIAWAYSKDNKLTVEQMRKAKQAIPSKAEALAAVHTEVEGKLDSFITPLPVDGYIGNAFADGKSDALLPLLVKFAMAFIEMVEQKIVGEMSSRLSEADKKTLGKSGGPTLKDREALFMKWRDLYFEDNVKAAGKRGVRYAGMGQAHLDNLVTKGLSANEHPFEMDGKDITAFRSLTDTLKKKAK